MWIKTNPLPSHKLGELSKAIASSPFCKFYQTLEDNTLLTYLLIDRQFSPAVRHLSDLFTEYDAIGESLIVEDSLLFSITKEMFKDGYGWLRPTISINRITVNEIELGGRGD